MPVEPGVAGSRRDRLRVEMMASIRERAYGQLAEGGPESLSLNAIAKSLGVSGPALYRYFASRDELLATLVTESWEELANVMEEAARAVEKREAPERLRNSAATYRTWALENPHRYRLLTGSRFGMGPLNPEGIVPASSRTMRVVLRILADLVPRAHDRGPLDPALSKQLLSWAEPELSDAGSTSELLLRGILAQTRLHGILSLELEGYFEQLGLDGALVYNHEVENLIG